MSDLKAQAQAIAERYLSEGLALRNDYPGRLSELANAQTLDKLFAALADGNYISTATRLAGIDAATYHRWLKRAEQEPESAYAMFATAVKEAECEAEAAIVADVRKAARKEQFWAAGMTLLERKYPDKWGKRNDDQSVPKVVVQIGAGAGEVKVGIIQPTFAPETSTDSLCITGLSGDVESNNNELCKPTGLVIESVPTSVGETETATSCNRIPGGTLPVGGVADTQHTPALEKGRSRARKKKGHGAVP